LNTYDFLADDSMRLSVLEACTGALITSRAITAAIQAAEYIVFMVYILLVLLLGLINERSLLPEDLLDLTDLLLYFAGYLFVFSVGFHLGIHAEFPTSSLSLPLLCETGLPPGPACRISWCPPVEYWVGCRKYHDSISPFFLKIPRRHKGEQYRRGASYSDSIP